MIREARSPYSFGSSFVQERDKLRVVAQIDELASRGSSTSQLMTYRGQTKKWVYYSLEWTAISLAARASAELFVLGMGGEILVGSSNRQFQENVDLSLNGPRTLGPMRAIRWIGEHLYAVGMSRQVYRRESEAIWVHRDAGVLLEPIPAAVTGFNSIDGLTEDDFYAVGFGGEIWRCLNRVWTQIESPTNVILSKVRVIGGGLIYACGQKGVLLQGDGNSWRQINEDNDDLDLWDMEWFQGHLYVANSQSVLILDPQNQLIPVSFGNATTTCRHLHAGDGVLLSSGAKDVFWTEDGKVWNRVTPGTIGA